MRKLFLGFSIIVILSGCAEIDHTEEYLLKEIRSINDIPEERGAPPDEIVGEEVGESERPPEKK